MNKQREFHKHNTNIKMKEDKEELSDILSLTNTMKKKHQTKLTKELTLEKRELIVQTDKNFYLTDFHRDQKSYIIH